MSEPALAKAVTIERSLATVPEVFAEITKQTGQKLSFAPDVAPLKLNVYVKDQPAQKVLGWLAEVLESEWITVFEQPKMRFRLEDKQRRDHFLFEEHKLLVSKVAEQADALARLTLYPYGQTPSATKEDPEVWQWACRKANESAWYVAGLQHRLKSPWMANFYGFAGRTFPYAFTVEDGDVWSPTSAVEGIDDNSSRLKGYASASYADYSYGELLVRPIRGVMPEVDLKTREVLRYLRPAPELVKLPYASRIVSWEEGGVPPTPLKPVGEFPQPYPEGQFSLGQQAQVLARGAKIPVVTDAFRVPMHRMSLVQGSNLDQAVKTLRESESLFVHMDDGALLMRHGGFWRLRTNEPPEEAMRRLEAVEKPSLDDYAFALNAWMGEYAAYNASLNRLRSPQTLLLRAGQGPFLRWAPALLDYASLAEAERTRLWAGDVVERSFRTKMPKYDPKSIKLYTGPYEERAFLYAVLYNIPIRGLNRYKGLPYWASGHRFDQKWTQQGWGHISTKTEWASKNFSWKYEWSGSPVLEYLAGRNQWQKSDYYDLLMKAKRGLSSRALESTAGLSDIERSNLHRKLVSEILAAPITRRIENINSEREAEQLYRQLYFPSTHIAVHVEHSDSPGHGRFVFWFGNPVYDGVQYPVEIP